MAANRSRRTGDDEGTTRGTEAAGTTETMGATGAEAAGGAGAAGNAGGAAATGGRRGGRGAGAGGQAGGAARSRKGAAAEGQGGGTRRSRGAGGGAEGGGVVGTRATRGRGGAAAGKGARGGATAGRGGGRTGGRTGKTARAQGPDLKQDLRDWAAARSGGWSHQDWENLLGDLQSRGHDVGDREAVGRQLEQEKLALRLESVQGMGRARVQSLVDRFGTLYSLQRSSVDEIAEVPNITRSLAERIKQEVG